MHLKNKLLIFLCLLLTCLFTLTACGGSGSSNTDTSSDDSEEVVEETESDSSDSGDVDKSDAINVMMEVNGGKQIEMALYPHVAPETVDNFVNLVQSGFYDGLTFHRIIPGFVIQGGDPEGTGLGGSDKTIKGEFSSNGVENNLKHTRGVVAMARSQDPDSASSQFYIVLEDQPSLDGEYATFGEVIKGMEVVDEIAGVETDDQDKPTSVQTIEKMYVVE